MLVVDQEKDGKSVYVCYFRKRLSDIHYRTVNIPWPNAGMTDGDYLYAFREIVMPIAMEFAPSLVIGKIQIFATKVVIVTKTL